MARIRTIKPEAATSESLARVSRGSAWTFALLWTQCDDAGRHRSDPRLIKAAVYPLRDDITAEIVTAELDELEAEGCICRYVGPDSKAYLHVVNWFHQKIDHPGKSRLPECPHETHPAPSRASRETLASIPESQPTVPSTLDLVPKNGTAPKTKPANSKIAEPATDASVVVKAYVDGATRAGLNKPTGQLCSKVGRDAKRLLTKEHIPVDKLTAAAARMGAAGWDSLDRELQRMSADEAKARPRTAADVVEVPVRPV